MLFSNILNCCPRRGCRETCIDGKDLCKDHYEEMRNHAMEVEIKRLRIKIRALQKHEAEKILGLNPAPFRNVWVVNGSNWIYT